MIEDVLKLSALKSFELLKRSTYIQNGMPFIQGREVFVYTQIYGLDRVAYLPNDLFPTAKQLQAIYEAWVTGRVSLERDQVSAVCLAHALA